MGKLVEYWLKLQLPKEIAQSFRRSKAPTFENYIKRQFPSEEELDSDTDTWTYGEPIETYINQMFDEDEEKIFRKALAAANRKVRVMYKENGTTKYGWISKRKNSGALITRVWGKSTPSIVVSGVETQPNDTDLAFPENCAGTMLIDTMSFYQKLAKSEISTLIGTKKPRFNIEWESKFRSDRFRGLEKHTVMVDGKSRMRTGYFVPEEE